MDGVPSLLMQAAQSAAQADGVVPPMETSSGGMNSSQLMHQAQLLQQQQKAKAGAQSAGGKKKGPPLRRGKWTPEEEAYANRLIQEFKAGLLPLTDGTTLRTFLSKLLNCDPMRISKKFVGGNCIGKQVFRRRTADLNRLTPEQIQKSRAELSELERRFLERVAQTNRVKSSGVGGAGPPAGAGAGPMGTDGTKNNDLDTMANPPSPPWLQPPLGYKQGSGAAMAAANLVGGGANNRAAAAGRALLEGFSSAGRKSGSGMGGLSSHDSAGLLAMAELQRRASQQSLLNSMRGNSAQNFLAAAGSHGSSMAQLARKASAARMAGLGGNNSLNNLMMKGLSRDQLSQLAREGGLSSASLSNMIERKNSFDALMGLDFQSLQSIDNLANLIQNGGNPAHSIPSSGLKNWSAEPTRNGSSGSLSNAARRLASAGNMESLLRSLSGNNVKNANNFLNNNSNNDNGGTSNANLQSLLQNMQNGSSSMSSLLGASGNAASAASLANLLRENSGTGLSALRMQDGLNNRNSSVEDFLSLVAAGDIPHQDPSLLNIPLMHSQQNNGQGGNNNSNDAAAMLAQQQLLAQATGNSALANALASRSFGNLARNGSGNLGGFGNSGSAAALLAQAAGEQGSSASLKRKLLELEGQVSTSNKR